jgi:hypothetical protein
MIPTIAGNHWRESLAAWAIPKEILDQAPEDPWIHLPEARESEVLEFLKAQPKIAIRNLATIWWDVN